MLDSHPIHQNYTNPSFCNVLQIMNEIKVKEELKDKKAESASEKLSGSLRRRLTFALAKRFA